MSPQTYTQEELVAELTHRFGPNPMDWSFTCPSCKEAATAADFKAALVEHPRTNRDGSDTTASDVIGQECIGRTLGALTMTDADWKREVDAGRGRGCNWCAYGLFGGPVEVTLPDGRSMRCFPITEVVPA